MRLAIAGHLARDVGEPFSSPDFLFKKMSGGDLGRKKGRGFHDW